MLSSKEGTESWHLSLIHIYPNYDVAANIHVGDEIEAVVVRVNDGEGTITLSKKLSLIHISQ